MKTAIRVSIIASAAILSLGASGGAQAQVPPQSPNMIVAKDVDDLHSDNNKLNQENSLTERGQKVAGFGMTPNWHDVLTGSTMEGRAWPGNFNLTCNKWTSGSFGSHGRPHRPAWRPRHRLSALLECGAYVARLRSGRPGRHGRQRLVLLLRRTIAG